MSMSSTTLSVLGFALNSWLEGSAQLRNTLISNALGFNRRPDSVSRPSISSSAPSNPNNRQVGEVPLSYRLTRWLRKPERDLDEFEKTAMGLIDVTTSFILLKALGSGPLLPFILNPLTVVLPLPQRLSIDSVLWSRVVLTTFALCCIHEAERVSVSTFITAWRKFLREKDGIHIENVIARGDDIIRPPPNADDDNDEEHDECLICSGVGYDAPLSDSISSLTSVNIPSLGPLEAFCVTAPQKHVMHRGCFLAWSKAYVEQRPIHPVPVVIVRREGLDQHQRQQGGTTNTVVGEKEYLRAAAIMSASGLEHTTHMLRVTSMDDIWVSDIRRGVYYDEVDLNVDDVDANTNNSIPNVNANISHFTLHNTSSPGSTAQNAILATLLTKAPPCPGCRSAVQLRFTLPPPSPLPSTSSSSSSITPTTTPHIPASLTQAARAWIKCWRQLVTGRTILVKMATQIMFVAALVSMMKARTGKGRKVWMLR
ncbi:hypothetical protein BD410DRAFT_836230 [Rickenella mellea]|uniref:Uncharacterized protein n=1 Tax=Rickenella mellea TaxID=50990 RepID=A0A4Y7QHP1_9AGAM|nr:hypothetical protein BD410DRAFT_836230 [Rickenella mellea]